MRFLTYEHVAKLGTPAILFCQLLLSSSQILLSLDAYKLGKVSSTNDCIML